MPIYQYRCEDCGTEFEDLVRGAELPACPRCAGSNASKRFSTFAVPAGARGPAPAAGPGACGTCGDPRGPGACSLD